MLAAGGSGIARPGREPGLDRMLRGSAYLRVGLQSFGALGIGGPASGMYEHGLWCRAAADTLTFCDNFNVEVRALHAEIVKGSLSRRLDRASSELEVLLKHDPP